MHQNMYQKSKQIHTMRCVRSALLIFNRVCDYYRVFCDSSLHLPKKVTAQWAQGTLAVCPLYPVATKLEDEKVLVFVQWVVMLRYLMKMLEE